MSIFKKTESRAKLHEKKIFLIGLGRKNQVIFQEQHEIKKLNNKFGTQMGYSYFTRTN